MFDRIACQRTFWIRRRLVIEAWLCSFVWGDKRYVVSMSESSVDMQPRAKHFLPRMMIWSNTVPQLHRCRRTGSERCFDEALRVPQWHDASFRLFAERTALDTFQRTDTHPKTPQHGRFWKFTAFTQPDNTSS